jgi:pyruvate formate lyase activating enzyme
MMTSDSTVPPLAAKSPYELRVALGEQMTEMSVREALATGEMGFLHSYTTGSTVDGPGIRVVAWTTGCTWRCQYCHNPDTWTMTNGLPVSLEQAVEQLRKYRLGLQFMGGGFTLSGGDPLMQDRFSAKLLAAGKKMGIHTAIETNGALGARLSDEELLTIDLVLLGLKTFDPERHQLLTGQDNAGTIAFAQRLAALRRPVWIRFVLVPGLTDDPADMAASAAFAASLGVVQRVEVLPFHQLGRFKWQQLGLQYSLEQTPAPTPDAVKQACDIWRAAGLKVV